MSSSNATNDRLLSKLFSDAPATSNSPVQQLQPIMFGRKTPESKAPNSNSDANQFSAISPPIGSRFGKPPNVVRSTKFLSISVSNTIEPSNKSERIIWTPSPLKERSTFFGEHLEQVLFKFSFSFFFITLGKSRRAWEEASLDAYPKDPCTKFWDGYRGQKNVVIDEFRGDINVSHILRWFDRYPVNVECKFGAVTLSATTIWITSNVDPRDWYPDVNQDTKDALLRRLTITHFNRPLL